VKTKSKKRKLRHFNYFVIRSGKKIWMRVRKEKDIWEGLHEFYLIESKQPMSDAKAAQLFCSETGLPTSTVSIKSIRIKQILSHQEIRGKFLEVNGDGASDFNSPNGKFCSAKEIESRAKPVIIGAFFGRIKQL
jgi:A/G-specific adenine glycosylase